MTHKRCILATLAASTLSGHAARTNAVDISTVIGAVHWAPCYYMNASLPVLLDGGVALAGMQTRAIKLPLYDPADMLPWNSNWNISDINTVADLAAYPYFKTLFSNGLPGLNYQTFILVAYRWGATTDPSMEFCWNLTEADLQDSTTQFKQLTQDLMTEYAGQGKRFIYQHWEGDWAARCYSTDPSQPADPAVQARLVQWLAARQAGTDAGRTAYCQDTFRHTPAASSLGGSSMDCSPAAHSALMAAAGVEVYHATEVNLVASAMAGPNPMPNNVLAVLPHVQLDMVSYSSYETEEIPDGYGSPGLGAALDFIASHHNSTAASPVRSGLPAVYIGEYGVGLNQGPLSKLQNVTQNVLAYALSTGPSGVQRAAHAMFWQLWDNDDPAHVPSGRCTSATGPDFNASHLDGYWLILPNGTKTWAWGYLMGVINGSIPVPVPGMHGD